MAYEAQDYTPYMEDVTQTSILPTVTSIPTAGPTTTPTAAPDYSQLISKAYQDYLGRSPEEAAASYWTPQLSSGQLTEGDFLSAVRQSPEAVQGYKDYLTGLYKTEFNRTPDQPGLDYWTQKLSSGDVTKAQLPGLFQQSEEAQAIAAKAAADAKAAEEAKAKAEADKAKTAAADAFYAQQMEALRQKAQQDASRGFFQPAAMPTGVVPTPFQGGYQPTPTPTVDQPSPFAATPINVPVFGPAALPTRSAAPAIEAPAPFAPFPNTTPAATPPTIYSPTFFGEK